MYRVNHGHQEATRVLLCVMVCWRERIEESQIRFGVLPNYRGPDSVDSLGEGVIGLRAGSTKQVYPM